MDRWSKIDIQLSTFKNSMGQKVSDPGQKLFAQLESNRKYTKHLPYDIHIQIFLCLHIAVFIFLKNGMLLKRRHDIAGNVLTLSKN